MTDTTLSVVRKSIRPQAGNSWATIAERELPKLKTEDGIASLQSWNLHVYMRAPAPEGSPRAGNPILPSDVIFIEPPMAAA